MTLTSKTSGLYCRRENSTSLALKHSSLAAATGSASPSSPYDSPTLPPLPPDYQFTILREDPEPCPALTPTPVSSPPGY